MSAYLDSWMFWVFWSLFKFVEVKTAQMFQYQKEGYGVEQGM